jgi:hypothetical protein
MSFGIPVRNGLGIGLLATGTLATANASTSGLLINWFLATGVWDANGIWIDSIAYPTSPFFLDTGVWNPSGFWIDDEVYP